MATIHGRWQGERINKEENGTEFPIFLSTSNVVNDKGEPYGLVGIITRISRKGKNLKKH